MKTFILTAIAGTVFIASMRASVAPRTMISGSRPITVYHCTMTNVHGDTTLLSSSVPITTTPIDPGTRLSDFYSEVIYIPG